MSSQLWVCASNCPVSTWIRDYHIIISRNWVWHQITQLQEQPRLCLLPVELVLLSRLQLPPVEQRGPARWRLPHLPVSGDGADPTVRRDELFPSGAITGCRMSGGRDTLSSASVSLGGKMGAGKSWFYSGARSQKHSRICSRLDWGHVLCVPLSAGLWRWFGRGLPGSPALSSLLTHHVTGKLSCTGHIC